MLMALCSVANSNIEKALMLLGYYPRDAIRKLSIDVLSFSSSDNANPSFRSLVVLSSNLLMVADKDTSKLRLHSLHNGKLLATSQRLPSEPWDICVVDGKGTQVAVTLLGGQIEIMSVGSAAIKRVRTLDITKRFKYYNGVSALKSMDKLIVTGGMCDKDTREDWICWCLVSLEGHVGTIHKISKCVVPVGGSYLATSPNDSMVYISCYAFNDSTDNGVHMFVVKDGRKKFVYRHSDLPRPTDISVDRRGYIYVCNCEPPCIHQLTESGETVTVHREGMPPWPRVICWDEQHREFYFISGRNKNVWRFYPEWIDQQVLPPEILKMDESSQKLYREILATGKEKLYNIRVMIVGHQSVGKTSLTQCLLGQQVKENETESTEGIEVHTRCCQINHATGEWKRTIKTDELSLNDQRIASILSKYLSPRNNQDITEVMVTDPIKRIDPRTMSKLSLHDVITVPSTVDAGIPNIPIEGTVSQTVKVLDEAEERTCPEEIKNFVERARLLPIPESGLSYVTLLDFAGQSLFYTNHQAFMSWRTLYLLVTDMSLPLTDSVEEGAYSIDVSGKGTCNIKEYVAYWLNSIHSHVLMPEDVGMHREENSSRRGEGSGSVQRTTWNNPFVILVGTHSDKIHKNILDQTKKAYFNDIWKYLDDRPFLIHLVDEEFAISNLGSDPNINALKSKIFEIAQKQVYWGEEIPARWISLERALMELKNRGIPVMDYADVKSLNETLQVRIERPEELDLFLRFEHDMGHIIFFNTERLRKKVMLDPEWLIHGVRIWITSDQVIKRHPELSTQWFAFKNTGQLTSKLIEKLWSPHSEIHQHKEHLLDVMEKLNIIAKPLHTKKKEYYWVPCMVSMPAPDDMRKLQQNKDTTKTSTLCFRSKTNFIHVGVFHRLLATCLSQWAPAKEGNRYLLFRGLCVFDLNRQQQLLLSLNDFVIQATVIRFTKHGRIPDLPLCMTVRDNLYTALSEISDCLCPGSEFEICIKCKESSPLTNEGLHSITTLRTEEELSCSTHKQIHCVESRELLGFWEENKKQIPDIVLSQQRHATVRFTQLSSLVLDVGSKVLRKVLLYYTTTSHCTLDQYMKNKEPDILQLQKRKFLTDTQVDIIFPQSGQTDIDEYDITLASTLLNNIYPLLGQQEKQIIIDLCTKLNELAHCPSTKMSEQDFQNNWTKVTIILADLSRLCKDPNFDNKVQKEIQDIQQFGFLQILSNLPAILQEMGSIKTETSICDSVLRQLSKDLISQNWKFFFREFSVAENELIQVEIDYHGNVQEQIYQLLHHLKQRGSLNQTNIIQALESIGRNDLVDKYSKMEFYAC